VSSQDEPERRLQPWLHDLEVALCAPTQVWSGSDGQVRDHGAQGVYHGDVRVLNRAEITLDGVPPVPVLSTHAGADSGVCVGVARMLGGDGPDPAVRVERRRRVRPGRVEETIVVSSSAEMAVSTELQLTLASDLAPMDAVKSGARLPAVIPVLAGTALAWAGQGLRVDVHAPEAEFRVVDTAAIVSWPLRLNPGCDVERTWSLQAHDERALLGPALKPDQWEVRVEADDRRIERWVTRSLEDLRALRMVTVVDPDNVFLAAGAPWFLTLFGRDSLWAARMLLPLGTDLAGSTLRLLASRQGSRVDPVSAEEPGKILHEMRRDVIHRPNDQAGRVHLPPLYYGTVDATALWVILLHESWSWGLPDSEVTALLPTLERALEWMVDHGDPDGDGFCEYIDSSGSGLTNQGWKDSGDSVQWRDGRLATAPIALCEVQGYAYQAAIGGAELLSQFRRPGATRWNDWAVSLADRFRAQFWVHDEHGPYPAIALDAHKLPVDSLTSNIGHLLGTGLLNEAEEAALASRLISPEMSSGFGLRTMSTSDAGYSPLSYHRGSVWPHDTAIVLSGLARGGHHDAAAILIEALLSAAAAFDYRLPELFGGDARSEIGVPVPYPAACRPQAWSAAASIAVLMAVTGLQPRANGPTQLVPMSPSPVGALHVRGLRIAGKRVAVELQPDGGGLLVDD